MYWTSSVFLILFYSILILAEDEPSVIVNSTKYIGKLLKTWKENDFIAFRGIRYAEPPIGDLRFKDPQKLRRTFLNETYDASNDRNDCPSIYATNPSEDCLFLNVYTNSIQKNDELKPVIAFIHPGGFYVGSALSSFIGPQYLLEKSIVLVTFNYRLGSLGFLNIGTKNYPGNAGLKDQVFALRWIQENIHHFGGNPNDVTLFGYSAGSFSVQLHLVSSMSIGLFHKAILMSGTIPPQLQIPKYHQRNLVKQQAKLLNCNIDGNLNAILNCLKEKSTVEISNSLRKMFDFGKDNPIYLWLPVIEKDFGQPRFLTQSPYDSFNANEFRKVPILIGFTNGEFCTSAKDIITSPELLQDFNKHFDKLAPICYGYVNHPNKTEISGKLKAEYFQNSQLINAEHFKDLCDLFSDSLIRFGANYLTEIATKFVSVYQYRFSYLGRFSNINYPFGENRVEHLDDLMFLFKMELASFTSKDREAQVVDLMVHLWTSFASGNFTEFENWEYKTGNYAELTNLMKIQNNSIFKRNKFFNDIFF